MNLIIADFFLYESVAYFKKNGYVYLFEMPFKWIFQCIDIENNMLILQVYEFNNSIFPYQSAEYWYKKNPTKNINKNKQKELKRDKKDKGFNAFT